MSDDDRIVFGGVDTHRDTHVAAVVDTTGRVLDTASFTADKAGYEQLGTWLTSHGRIVRVGIEGTGRLRRRPVPPPHQYRCRGGGSEPTPTVNCAADGAKPTPPTPKERHGLSSAARPPEHPKPVTDQSKRSGCW